MKLTPRQEQIHQLLLTDLSHKQIAAQIGIAEKTAAVHRTALYRKLGAHDRQTIMAREIQALRSNNR